MGFGFTADCQVTLLGWKGLHLSAFELLLSCIKVPLEVTKALCGMLWIAIPYQLHRASHLFGEAANGKLAFTKRRTYLLALTEAAEARYSGIVVDPILSFQGSYKGVLGRGDTTPGSLVVGCPQSLCLASGLPLSPRLYFFWLNRAALALDDWS